MAINTATIQHRRGSLEDFNPEKLMPGEIAVITDERSVHMGFPGGGTERIILEKDFTSESIKEKLGYEPADEERVNQLLQKKADYQYVNEKVSNVKVDLTGYAKEDYVDAEIEELNKKIVRETGKLSQENAELKGDLVYVIERTPSINLYNPEIAMPGYYMYQEGTLGKNESITFSGYVPCGGLENVTITLFDFAYPGTKNQYCFYDASKNPIDGRKSEKPINGQASTIAVPTNAQFIGFQWASIHGTESTVMVEGGTVGSSSFVPYGDIVIVLPSDETKNARGEFSSLGERLNAIDSQLPKIIEYWGDSLTQGNQDGTGVSRSSVLSSLLGNGWSVENWGVGGEMSNTIAVRQGGMFAVAKPFTVPSSKNTSVVVDILDSHGNKLNFRSELNTSASVLWQSVNPVEINGIKGNLSRIGTSYSTTSWNFNRLEDGDEIVFDRPYPILTNLARRNKKSVLIIWVGQNNGYQSDDGYLIEQIRYMIDNHQTERYLVIGFYTANTGRSMSDALNTNKALEKAFGNHFIDIYKYMITPIYNGDSIVSCYGIADNGLTATAQDITQISNGEIPQSLRCDNDMHLNQYGYTVVANLEHQRGKLLGYW